jgi:hypothetical protein
MKRTSLFAVCGFGVCAGIALVEFGCGKEDSGGDSGGKKPNVAAPGTLNLPNAGSGPDGTVVVADTKAKVQVAGSIAVGTYLTDTSLPDTLMAFPLYRGQFITNDLGTGIFDLIQTFSLDASGAFQGTISSLGLAGSRALKCIGADGKIDVELCRDAWKYYSQSGIEDRIAKGQLGSWVESLLDPSYGCSDSGTVTSLSCANNYTRALVLYKKSETNNRVAEADSFRFLGFASGASGVLANIPLHNAKNTSVNMGSMSLGATGSVVRSETAAIDTFTFSSNSLRALAATNGALKTLKNAHMNFSPETRSLLSANAIYTWKSSDKLGDLTGFSNPANISLSGYSIGVGGEGTQDTVTADMVCGSVGASGRKIFTLTYQGAGEGIKQKTNESGDSKYVKTFTTNVAMPLDSKNSDTSKRCTEPLGSALGTGFTWSRRDSASTIYNWSLAWGTSYGSPQFALTDAIPEGHWDLAVDGDRIGTFELGAGHPIQNGKPILFLPKVRIDRDSNGTITDVRLRFAYWDTESSAWGEATDEDALNLVSPVHDFSGMIDSCGDSSKTLWVRLLKTTASDGGLEYCLSPYTMGAPINPNPTCADWAALNRKIYNSSTANTNSAGYTVMSAVILYSSAFGTSHTLGFSALEPLTSCTLH